VRTFYSNLYKPFESDLKVNDLVIVIESDKDSSINLGQRWEIDNINEYGLIYLKDAPTNYGYHPYRFEKIEETEV